MITFAELQSQPCRPTTGQALLIDGDTRKLIKLTDGIAPPDFLIVDLASWGYRGTSEGVAFYVRDKALIK